MSEHVADFKGLKCPQPTLKATLLARKLPPGTMLKIIADCPTFAEDIKTWCEEQGKVLIVLTNTSDGTLAQIQL